MMDDIAEQQDVAKEISEAISNPVAFGSVSVCIQQRHLVSIVGLFVVQKIRQFC